MGKIFEFDARKGSLINEVDNSIGVLTVGDGGFKKTEKGLAMNFDGSSTNIEYSEIELTSGDFTIEAIVKFNELNVSIDTKTILSLYQGGDNSIALNTEFGGDKIQFFSRGGDSFIGSTSMKIGTYYHIIIVNEGGIVSIYLNGTFDGSGTPSISYPTEVCTLYVGTERSSYYHNGYIVKCVLHNNPFSLTDIHNSYNDFLRSSPITKGNASTKYVLSKPNDLSHERNTHYTGDEYIQVMEFTDNASDTSSLKLNNGGDFAVVDWTGNSDFQEISTSSETESNVIPSTVKIFAKNGVLTYFESADNDFDFNLNILPSSLTDFRCYGNNTVSGDLAGLPSTLTYFRCDGNNIVSGDLADLPSTLTYFICYGSNTISTYTSGHTFNSGIDYFLLLPAAGYGLDSTEVDNLLIDLDNSGMSSGTIDISGNNAARTSASDAAVTSLEGKGVSVTTN
ncbi:MAG TPA: LamG-like jellyroll fold domain-containing protein [Halanaerobiales bacterium]|nr:LamG-like jellyroll fold domain-containing protein [Halanaerobiales bacterium]